MNQVSDDLKVSEDLEKDKNQVLEKLKEDLLLEELEKPDYEDEEPRFSTKGILLVFVILIVLLIIIFFIF